MLEPRHIVRLKLDRARLAAHAAMPLPKYVSKPLIGQFTALSDTILASLLGIAPDQFGQQLETARKYGAALLREDGQANPVGISACTSVIKSGTILSKHLIVPQDCLRYDRRLTDHIMVGAFVHGEVKNGSLVCSDNIEIAGWATAADIKRLQAAAQPPMFQSKLNVIMVPCTSLRPMSEFFTRMQPSAVSI